MPREANEYNPMWWWLGGRSFPPLQSTGLATFGLPALKLQEVQAGDKTHLLLPPGAAAKSARLNGSEQLAPLPPVAAISARRQEQQALPLALRMPLFSHVTVEDERSSHIGRGVVPKPPSKPRERISARKRIAIELGREHVEEAHGGDALDEEEFVADVVRHGGTRAGAESREARECRPGKPRRAHRSRQPPPPPPPLPSAPTHHEQQWRRAERDGEEDEHRGGFPSSIAGSSVVLPRKLQRRLEELRLDENAAMAFDEHVSMVLSSLTYKPPAARLAVNPRPVEPTPSHREAARQLKLAEQTRREADAASKRVERSILPPGGGGGGQPYSSYRPRREDEDEDSDEDDDAAGKQPAAKQPVAADSSEDAEPPHIVSVAPHSNAKDSAAEVLAGDADPSPPMPVPATNGAAAPPDSTSRSPGSKKKQAAVSFKDGGGGAAKDKPFVGIWSAFETTGKPSKKVEREAKAFMKEAEAKSSTDDINAKREANAKAKPGRESNLESELTRVLMDAPAEPRLKRRALASALHKIR